MFLRERLSRSGQESHCSHSYNKVRMDNREAQKEDSHLHWGSVREDISTNVETFGGISARVNCSVLELGEDSRDCEEQDK